MFGRLRVSPPVMQALKRMGFEKPTPIQEAAIPFLLQGSDVVGQAQTGTGKTAAFGIPIAQCVKPVNELQALILVPTRELALQVAQELTQLSFYTGLKVTAVYGGVSLENQVHALKTSQVAVATPGRLIDHFQRGTIDFSKLKVLVIDEADRMLDMGFIDDVDFILSKTPPYRQLVLFSATMPTPVIELASKYMNTPEHVSVSKDELTVKDTKQFYVSVDPRQKAGALVSLLRSKHYSIVFCRTKRGADALSEFLGKRGLKAVALHGNLTQSRREKVMQLFKKRVVDVLVATDLAARGLDIPDVSCVINFDLSDEPNVYVHRIGRTGRAGKVGEAVSFVTNLAELRYLQEIERLSGVKIGELKLDLPVLPPRPPGFEHGRGDRRGGHPYHDGGQRPFHRREGLVSARPRSGVPYHPRAHGK